MVDDENGSDLHVLVSGVKSLLCAVSLLQSRSDTGENKKASDVSSFKLSETIIKSMERRVWNGRIGWLIVSAHFSC
jgi:hypothetical protein